MHVKGYAAPDTKAVAETANMLIAQAVAAGEVSEDPLLLFSALFGIWNANVVAGSSDIARELSEQFRTLAQKQEADIPLLMSHRVMGVSLLYTGHIAESRSYFDKCITLYQPAEHRSLATRFGVDARVSMLSYRAWDLWMLGYPEAALTDVEVALKDARDSAQAANLMFSLVHASVFHYFQAEDATTAAPTVRELLAVADDKHAMHWKRNAIYRDGYSLERADRRMELKCSGLRSAQCSKQEPRRGCPCIWHFGPVLLRILANSKRRGVASARQKQPPTRPEKLGAKLRLTD